MRCAEKRKQETTFVFSSRSTLSGSSAQDPLRLGQHDRTELQGLVGYHPFEGRGGVPTAHLLISKTHAAWGIFDKPGHPAAKPSPDQRRTPPCSWLRTWSVHLSSPHPCPENMYPHVCSGPGIPSSLGPQVSPPFVLLTDTQEISPGEQGRGLGLTDLLVPRLGRPWGWGLEGNRG